MFNAMIFRILLLVAGAWVTVSVLLSLLDVLLYLRAKERKTSGLLLGVGLAGLAASGFAIATLVFAWTMVAEDQHGLLPGVLAITVGIAGSWVGLLWASSRRVWAPVVGALVLLALCGLWWFVVLGGWDSVVILTGGPSDKREWEKERKRTKKLKEEDKKSKEKN